MPLLEDGLRLRAGRLKLVLGVVAEPEELPALQALDVGGFGAKRLGHEVSSHRCARRLCCQNAGPVRTESIQSGGIGHA